jgi:hypothetical protein
VGLPTLTFLPSSVRKPFAAIGRPFVRAGARVGSVGRSGAGRVKNSVGSAASRAGNAGGSLLDRIRAVPKPMLAAIFFTLLYVGWIAYSTAARGPDAGLGVLVSWPTLLLAAAIVTAPFAGIVFLAMRFWRGTRPPRNLGELKVDTITDVTFPA